MKIHSTAELTRRVYGTDRYELQLLEEDGGFSITISYVGGEIPEYIDKLWAGSSLPEAENIFKVVRWTIIMVVDFERRFQHG